MAILTVLFRALLVICIGLATSASTCLHVTNPGGLTDAGAIDVAPQTFSHCTSDTIKSIGASMQGRIADALASNDYEGALAKLVADFTVDEVKCGIEIWLGSNARKQESMDALMRLQVSRATSWLSAN